MVRKPASRLTAYVAAYRDANYPEKASELLAAAFMAKCRANGRDPEREDVHEEFVLLSQQSSFYNGWSTEQEATLQGLLRLVELDSSCPLPGWVDSTLKELDWRYIFRHVKDPRYTAFLERAEKLGHKPSVRQRLSDVNPPDLEGLPSDLVAAVLDDKDGCRGLWRDKIVAEPLASKPLCIHQVLNRTQDRTLQRYFCETLADDLGLSGAERQKALEEPSMITFAVRWGRDLHPRYGGTQRPDLSMFSRFLARRRMELGSSWGDLGALSDIDLVELVKQWSSVVVGGLSEANEHDREPWDPADVVRLYSPILREVANRGDTFFALLAREVLSSPPTVEQPGEDWRTAFVDLSSVVSHYSGWRLSPRRLASGDRPGEDVHESGWREFWESAEPRFIAAMAAVAADPALPLELAPWVDIVVGERRPFTGTASRIVDLALQGLGCAGNWALVEDFVRRFSGEAERYTRLRQSVKQAVIASVDGEHAKTCEQFVIRLLSNPLTGPAEFGPDLAVSFALRSTRNIEVDEVLSTPERAELNSLAAKFHQWSVAPAQRVELARRLKHRPEVLGALLDFFRKLPVKSQMWIPADDPMRASIDLGDLLYATGDSSINPKKECSWPRNDIHLVHWHLGAGHGIEEFFKDICGSQHGKGRELPLWMAALAPDRVQTWMAEHIAETDDGRVPDVVQAMLRRVESVLYRAERPELTPDYKTHSGWNAFVQSCSGPPYLDLVLQRFPQRHMPLLEAIYRRLHKLASLTSGAWPLFVNFAVLMADNPAYANLVTEETKKQVLEEAKAVLMKLRTAASSALPADSGFVPEFYPALCALYTFKSPSAALRQLLLVYREIPFPSVPKSLAAHVSPTPEIGWFMIPHTITWTLRSSAPEQREELLHCLGDYLQERLKPREQGVGREVEAREGEHQGMVEPNPVLREAYVEALGDLRTDRGGRLHRLLGNVALEDPSPQVKDAARRCATRAKQAGKEPSRLSLGRIILNAWWWIRFGTTLRFGEDKVNRGSADNVKVTEVTLLRGES